MGVTRKGASEVDSAVPLPQMRFAMDLERGDAGTGLTATMRVACREVAPRMHTDREPHN